MASAKKPYDVQLGVRMSATQRASLDKLAAGYHISSSELVRLMVEAALSKTLRIVTTNKTTRPLTGIHIDPQ